MTEEFFIDQEGVTTELSELMGDTVCIFNQFCNDSLIAGNSAFEAVDYQMSPVVQNSFSRCAIEGKCGGRTVATRRMRRFTMPVAAYRQLVLTYLRAGLINLDDVDQLFTGIPAEGNECNLVKFCPLTLVNYGDTWLINHNAQPGSGINEDNCLEINCTIFAPVEDYNVCEHMNFFLGGFDSPLDPTQPTISCTLTRLPVLQLINWREQMLTNLPGFDTSSLNQFLADVESTPFLLERAACAHVTYCSNTFEFLGSDINQIDCNQYVQTQSVSGLDTIVVNNDTIFFPEVEIIAIENCKVREDASTSNLYQTQCIVNGNVVRNWFDTDFDIDIFNGLLDSDIPTVLVNDIDADWKFRNLSYVRAVDGNITPKAILSHPTKGSHFLDFVPSSLGINQLFKEDSLLFVLIDHALETDYLVFQNDTKTITYQVIGTEADIEHTIVGTSKITAEPKIRNGQLVLQLESEGKIVVNGEEVISETFGKSNSISVRINESGEIEATSSLKIDEIAKHFLRREKQNTSFGGFISENVEVKIENNQEVTLTSGSLIAYDSENGSLASVLTPFINLSTQAFCKNTTSSEYVYFLSNQTVEESSHLLILTDQESILWYNNLDCTGTISDQFLFSAGVEGYILAITFTGKVTYDNVTHESNGGKDILFLFVDNSGNLISTEQYGTEGDENIQKADLINDVLVFGGNYNGTQLVRDIGEIQFLQLSYDLGNGDFEAFNVSRPYVSYFTLKVHSEKLAKLEQKTAPDNFKVYPNPTRSNWVKITMPFFLNFNDGISVQVQNTLGQVLLNVPIEQGGEQAIDLSSLRPQVLYLSLLSNHTLLGTQKLILL